MFDIGFGELLILGLIGLIVLGPERLPKLAHQLGQLLHKARNSWQNLRRELEREIDFSNDVDDLRRLKGNAQSLREELHDSVQQPAKQLQDSRHELLEQLNDIYNAPQTGAHNRNPVHPDNSSDDVKTD